MTPCAAAVMSMPAIIQGISSMCLLSQFGFFLAMNAGLTVESMLPSEPFAVKRTSSGHQADIKQTSSGHQADIKRTSSGN